ncbi:unnamed protein product [Clonostachys rosea]|uniref:PLAC8 family protein n=1 Tax=Bionectria ochroleuca TaxID=29856 RepID=A0ABY6UR95_BIOOC|nr:unnamed protein product [Clonostachys rosea]
MSESWQSSLCGCGCGSCLLGTFLPCLIAGRTKSRREDPSNPSPDMCNGDCAVYGLLHIIGCSWIFTMVRRGDIRGQYNIQGSGCGDCCTSFWCPCCATIQNDNEVKERLLASGPVQQAYQPQKGMQVPGYQ